jgi:NodT family efflux transporter outer membrane factor (OMF) lipoprotein
MKKRVAFLSSIMLLAGCVPGGIVPQQSKIATDAIGLSDAPTPAIDRDWWIAFDDPALDRLMKDALAGNPNLGEALARLRLAKAGVESANAALYPRLDLNAQEQRERLSDVYIIPPPYGGSYRWIGTVEGDLSWSIDFWGKQAAELAKARDLRIAAKMDFEAARLAVSGAVFQAYVDLDRAYKLDDIAAQTERERADTLALTERRVHGGLDSKVEEQEARALLAGAREAKASADANRDIVVHELAALVGRGADAYSAIARPSLKLEAVLPLPAALPADLLARRPDIAAAQARIDAATQGRKAAKAEFYPNVDLLASAGWAAVGLSPMFGSRAEQFGAGPAVHLPLFDAGTLRAQYAGATAEIDDAVAGYNSALVDAVRQTADALTRIHALEQQIAEHRQMLEAAEAGYQLAQSRYRNGLTNQLTVLSAQNILFGAREGDVSLQAERSVQRVTLLLAVGGGFQPAASTQLSDR